MSREIDHQDLTFLVDDSVDHAKQIARAGHLDVLRKLQTVVYPQLKQHPHFGPHIRKLKQYEPETWRYRIGAWRFFYEIDDRERLVLMTTASHRSSAH